MQSHLVLLRPSLNSQTLISRGMTLLTSSELKLSTFPSVGRTLRSSPGFPRGALFYYYFRSKTRSVIRMKQKTAIKLRPGCRQFHDNVDEMRI